jgi:hypothetical protein
MPIFSVCLKRNVQQWQKEIYRPTRDSVLRDIENAKTLKCLASLFLNGSFPAKKKPALLRAKPGRVPNVPLDIEVFCAVSARFNNAVLNTFSGTEENVASRNAMLPNVKVFAAAIALNFYGIVQAFRRAKPTIHHRTFSLVSLPASLTLARFRACRQSLPVALARTVNSVLSGGNLLAAFFARHASMLVSPIVVAGGIAKFLLALTTAAEGERLAAKLTKGSSRYMHKNSSGKSNPACTSRGARARCTRFSAIDQTAIALRDYTPNLRFEVT